MDSSLQGLDQIAAQLANSGLSIMAAGTGMRATNQLANLTEAILDRGGQYVTSSGYELGSRGDEANTARRLAYLLGVPLPRVNQDAHVASSACPSSRNPSLVTRSRFRYSNSITPGTGQ